MITKRITERSLPCALLVLTAALPMLAAIGCEWEYRVVHDPWADFPQDPKPNRGNGNSGDHAGLGYTVLLERFEGPTRLDDARQTVQAISEQSNVRDLWLDERRGIVSLYAGRFDQAGRPVAKETLRQVRAIEIDGDKRFSDATIEPIGTFNQIYADPYNLKSHMGKLTLQIGFYDKNFGPGFRQAAEKAVIALRKDGEEAYYYHGPHRSLITVGLFTRADFEQVGNTERYGPAIRALRKKYPHNLANGLTLEQTIGGQDAGAQESFIVRVF